MFNFDLNKIDASTALASITTFISIFFTGGLFIFVLKPSLFLEIDFFKLLLISGAITTPFLLINTLLLTRYKYPPGEALHIQSAITISALFTSTIFYLAIFAVIFIPLILNSTFELLTKTIFLFIIFLELVIILFFIIDGDIHNKEIGKLIDKEMQNGNN